MKKIRVGRVSMDMIDRVRTINEQHDRQHEEMNDKIEAYKDKVATEAAAKMKAFIDKEQAAHAPDCLQARREMAAAWDEIHDELGLPESERALNYQLNAVTGDITKEVPADPEETETVTLYN